MSLLTGGIYLILCIYYREYILWSGHEKTMDLADNAGGDDSVVF